MSELKILKEHNYQVQMQLKAFKQARAQPAEEVCTIHIDWSENTRLLQAGEEHSAY